MSERSSAVPQMAVPTARPLASTQKLPPGVFSLGVASGDPVPDGFVLWTRLAPDPLHGGGLGERVVDVEWQVATDSLFTHVVASGVETVLPELAHSLHVEVGGLAPGTSYVYRFRAGRQVSQVGRTRTAPALTAAPARVRFAVASCQDWSAGYFTAHQALVREQDLAFVLFLGDYIYETAPTTTSVRRHVGTTECLSIADYRNRYAQYKTDPALQAAHAAHPWIVSMDDHEVENDWAGAVPPVAAETPTRFHGRRVAALQAWWEHMPVRWSARPRGVDAQLYRRFSYGDLLQLDVLDSRPFRRRPVTMLGSAQEQWLTAGLAASRTQWNVIGNQVMLARSGTQAGEKDDWDAFPTARTRLLRSMQPTRNPVAVSGDIHHTWACDLVERFGDEASRVLASEITGTSMTSGGDADPAAFHRLIDPLAEPHWKYWDDHRGYLLCDVDRARMLTQLRTVSAVEKTAATTRTRAGFVVEDRVRGLTVEGT